MLIKRRSVLKVIGGGLLALFSEPLIAQASFFVEPEPLAPIECIIYADGTTISAGGRLHVFDAVTLSLPHLAIPQIYAFIGGTMPTPQPYSDKIYRYTDPKGVQQDMSQCTPRYKKIHDKLIKEGYDGFVPGRRSTDNRHLSVMAARKGSAEMTIQMQHEGSNALNFRRSHAAILQAGLAAAQELAQDAGKSHKDVIGAGSIVEKKKLSGRGTELRSKDGGYFRYRDEPITIVRKGKKEEYDSSVEIHMPGTVTTEDHPSIVPVLKDPNAPMDYTKE